MSEPSYIVISGASSGIGAALANSLVGDGNVVFVCARRKSKLSEMAQGQSRLRPFICDVSQEEQVQSFAEFVRDQAPQVDALINCAGSFGAIGPAIELDSAAWWHSLQVNLFGTFLMIKYFVPQMKGSRSPRVLNFSGGGGLSPFPNYSAYAVSKSGVIRLTENLAEELALSGISVNAVAPGFVATEIHEATLAAGIQKAGNEHYELTAQKLNGGSVPMEVVIGCVRYLLSDHAEGLTGKTVSASFDPWSNDAFSRNIDAINESDLYTLRRINLDNIQPSALHDELANSVEK